MTVRTVFLADIGKSTTRVALARNGVIGTVLSGAGIPGLAESGGARAAQARIDALTPGLGSHAFHAVSVGAAGALSAPEAAEELARLLADRWSTPASVTSDVVAAHVGALDGEVGTILIAGTGAVALGVRDDGGFHLTDGLGPELGDHGSGYWIGRAGLRSTLRAGSETILAARALEHLEHLDAPRWLAQQEHPLAAVARFAPVVLDCARSGDDVARGICDAAIRELTATTRDASSSGDRVSVLGGLASHAWFANRLRESLAQAGLRPEGARGSAMDGALLIADRATLPHERLIHRVL
ncbi:N-acetylglucosamine kinase [Microbacterium aurum]